MKKFIIPLVALLALFLTGCETTTTGSKDLSQSNGPTVNTSTKDKPAEKDTGPKLSPAQKNAIDSANQYLQQSAFSRSGLIDQLKFEKFGPKVAAFAVDYIHPDWNVQAAKSAKEYLDQSSFSRGDLIGQLKYEGFTTEQATYGVNKAYK
jgi:colicin import membrane protein